MSDNTKNKSLKQKIFFFTGLAAVIVGMSVLGFFAVRKLHREYIKYKLMSENPVIEISDINIKAPVLEGTDNEILAQAAGHFTDTGDFGKGNYCIAAHSSTIYKEYFNNLKNISMGTDIVLYDVNKNQYTYTANESYVVKPSETWVLDDFGDNRITLITCTDDGSQRFVVVGILKENIAKE